MRLVVQLLAMLRTKHSNLASLDFIYQERLRDLVNAVCAKKGQNFFLTEVTVLILVKFAEKGPYLPVLDLDFLPDGMCELAHVNAPTTIFIDLAE